MSISGLVRRLVKGTALTAAEHDANLDAIEAAVDAKVEGTAVTAIVGLTSAQYAALSPKSSTTLYVITDAFTGANTIYLGSAAIAAAPNLS
jgi:hypothetical protein